MARLMCAYHEPENGLLLEKVCGSHHVRLDFLIFRSKFDLSISFFPSLFLYFFVSLSLRVSVPWVSWVSLFLCFCSCLFVHVRGCSCLFAFDMWRRRPEQTCEVRKFEAPRSGPNFFEFIGYMRGLMLEAKWS